MNPLPSLQAEEEIVCEARVHPGIFSVPILLLLLLLLLTVPMLFYLSGAGAILASYSQGGHNPLSMRNPEGIQSSSSGLRELPWVTNPPAHQL